MYLVSTEVKGDPVRQWNLPDRVFFAAGACHVLAYSVAERFPESGFTPIWIKPDMGHTGHHILMERDGVTLDYRGFSTMRSVMRHTRRKARRRWPDWDCTRIELTVPALLTSMPPKRFPGLFLKQARFFLHDALPRAHDFLSSLLEAAEPR